MKDNRQIRLAKQILESAGYTVKKLSESNYGTMSNPMMLTRDDIKDYQNKGYETAVFKQSIRNVEADKYASQFGKDAKICINIDAYPNMDVNHIYPEHCFILYKEGSVKESSRYIVEEETSTLTNEEVLKIVEKKYKDYMRDAIL